MPMVGVADFLYPNLNSYIKYNGGMPFVGVPP